MDEERRTEERSKAQGPGAPGPAAGEPAAPGDRADAPATAPGGDDPRYRRAAAAYLGLGLAVVAITVASPELLRPERRADLAHLAAALPFVGLFAALIAWGDRWSAAVARALGAGRERARRIGRHVREKLVMLLTLSAAGRTLVFLGEGAGRRLDRTVEGWSLAATEPRPRMLLCAALTATIAVLLARASWAPFLRRRLERRAGRPC
ncbi:MAG: hypothetical protein ACOC92_00805 [bacterium]